MPLSRLSHRTFVWILVGSVYLVLGLVHTSGIVDNWVLDGDNSVYVALAKSLAEGEGYQYSDQSYPSYPPVWPAMMAGLMIFGEDSALGLRLLYTLLLVIGTGLVHAFAWYRAGPWIGTSVALLFGASPFFLGMTPYLYSEGPYIVFSFAALLVVSYVCDYHGARPGLCLLGGLLCGLSVMTRMVGLALCLVATLSMIANTRYLRKKKLDGGLKALVLFVLAWVLPMGAWTFFVVDSQGETPRNSFELLKQADPLDASKGSIDMAILGQRARDRYEEEIDHAAEILSAGLLPERLMVEHRWVWSLLILIPALILGFRRHDLSTRYAILFTLFVLLWPLEAGARLLLPIAPLLWLVLFSWVDVIPNRTRTGVVALVVLGATVVGGLGALDTYRSLPSIRALPNKVLQNRSCDQSTLVASLFIGEAVKPGETFAAFPGWKEAEVSGCKLHQITPTTDRRALFQEIKDVNYVVVDEMADPFQATLLSVLLEHKRLFDMAYSSGHVHVFWVRDYHALLGK